MIKHPATYSTKFIPIFAELLINKRTVLDPFGGIGKLAEIKKHGYTGKIICNEIESEWVAHSTHQVDQWNIGDAQDLSWLEDSSIEAICTSPTYGNRMADSFVAKDTSKRITYTHYLGRKLSKSNTGAMQWGDKYRAVHQQVYSECYRVLKNDGLMIVNISNHIRKGIEIDVVQWHESCLKNHGLTLIEHRKISTPRMGFGSNGNIRVKTESILIFEKRT
jgi:tRNA G10  N-methylase Trm11